MEETFFDLWMNVGDPDHRYREEYAAIPLEESKEVIGSESIKVAPGYSCLFANRLRNSNCLMNLRIPKNPTVKVEKINASETRALYNCADSFLAEHHGIWALYSASSFEKTVEGNWGNNECSYYCFESGFYIFDDILKQYSADGRLLNKIFLSTGSDINHHEIAQVNGYTISSGYLKADSWPDGLPGNLLPSGQLESFQPHNLLPLEDPDDIQELERSHRLAFLEDNPLLPVYLDDRIVQPLANKIALISFDMKVLKVLEGDFEPLAISSNSESIQYMAAQVDDAPVLFSFDINGGIMFKTTIPGSLGMCMAPPRIGINGNIFWVGENGVSAYNSQGELLWTKHFPSQPGRNIKPLLYNDVLTLCIGATCVAYDPDGNLLFSIDSEKGQINTPLLSNKQGRHFVGTTKGIYEIRIE